MEAGKAGETEEDVGWPEGLWAREGDQGTGQAASPPHSIPVSNPCRRPHPSPSFSFSTQEASSITILQFPEYKPQTLGPRLHTAGSLGFPVYQTGPGSHPPHTAVTGMELGKCAVSCLVHASQRRPITGLIHTLTCLSIASLRPIPIPFEKATPSLSSPP